MSVVDALRAVKVRAVEGGIGFWAPGWTLVLVFTLVSVWVGKGVNRFIAENDNRITALEVGMGWTQTLLRTKFPREAESVDEAYEESERLRRRFGARPLPMPVVPEEGALR